MEPSRPFRIVIVGGGIAGLTAAIALRARNRQIIVLEQSRLNTEIGALISLQPNASKIVYETLGLGKELEGARGTVDEGFRVYSTDGELANEVPLTTNEYGASRIVYHRRDLHDALKRAALATDREGEAVEIRVSSRVVHCDPINGTVETEKGERIYGDVIIGADGIHSVIRKYVLDDEITPLPTGHSDVLEEQEPEFCSKINPRSPFTSMMVAHDCRLIMGPGRQGEVFGIVALVPDERMNEDPNAKQSWVSEGSLEKMLDTFSEFPDWVTSIFKHSRDLGLWQLRDIDPLRAWYRGRVLLIGDAAHAMLPTQGQGASQAIEDAEALGAFFAEQVDSPSLEEIGPIFEEVHRSRHNRAGLIQAYSRQAAKPGTAKGGKTVTMKPDEFMTFNCKYHGAKDWLRRQTASSA
ncbi:2-polyprenyl-6-methoxyphenol hydroxylase [Aspergillus nidulans var. acristatus]